MKTLKPNEFWDIYFDDVVDFTSIIWFPSTEYETVRRRTDLRHYVSGKPGESIVDLLLRKESDLREIFTSALPNAFQEALSRAKNQN